MFQHRSRSGRVWPCNGHNAAASRSAPSRGPPPEGSPILEPNHDVRGVKEVDRGVNVCILVKDLRSRRVFTPSSLPMECSLDRSPEAGGAGKPYVPDQMDAVVSSKGMAGVMAKAEASPDPANVTEEVSGEVGVVEEGAVQTFRTVGGSEEEGIESTPPEAHIISKSEAVAMGFTEGVSEEEGIEGTPPDANVPSKAEAPAVGFAKDGSEKEGIESMPPDVHVLSQLEAVGRSAKGVLDTASQRSGRCADEGFPHRQKNWSDQSHNKLGTFPGSRMKLVRDPNSFSYRRLLPFLVNLTKSTSSTLEVLPCQNCTVKAENELVDNSIQPLSSSTPQPKLDLLGKTNTDSEYLGHTSKVPHTLDQKMKCSPGWSPEIGGAGKSCVSDQTDTVERADGIVRVIVKADSPTGAANVKEEVSEKVGVMVGAEKGADQMFPTVPGFQEEGIESTPPEVPILPKSEDVAVGFATDGSGEEGIEGMSPDLDLLSNSEAVTVGFANDGSERENIESTPPDVHLHSRLEVDTASQQSGGGAEEGFLDRQKKESDQSRNRLGIFPCSRMKLVRDPNSFSYRRLLPFLMDLNKSNSSSLEVLPCQNHTIKAEKPLVDQGIQLFSSSHTGAKMDSSGKTSKDSDLTLHMREAQDSLEQPVNKTYELLSGNSNDNIRDTASKSSSTYTRDARSLPQFNAYEHAMICRSSSNPPPSSVLFLEELIGIQGPTNLPRQSETASTMIANGCMEHSTQASQFGVSGPTGGKHSPSILGILKRHRGECIGFCMCLNCSSFRLHAERAFEFSRRQMQETEDVATGLINELSCLRKLVERHYATGMGVTSNGIHQHGQVKGLCRKASRAEELARKRLKEMNDDLHAHCRITRPRVTFVESIEKQSISAIETVDTD